MCRRVATFSSSVSSLPPSKMSNSVLTVVVAGTAAFVVMAQIAAVYMFFDMSNFEENLMKGLTNFKVRTKFITGFVRTSWLF